MAKFIIGDRAFTHRSQILWLGCHSRLKDHDRVRWYKLFERVCVSVLSGFPDPLLELNDRIDDRALGMGSVGLVQGSRIASFQGMSPAMQVRSSGSDAVLVRRIVVNLVYSTSVPGLPSTFRFFSEYQMQKLRKSPISSRGHAIDHIF